MNKIQINPIYGIRNDKYCSFIYRMDESFQTRIKKYPNALEIPPLYGYIISQFTGLKDTPDVINHITKSTGIRKESIWKFINQIIENDNLVVAKYKDQSIVFPPYLLKKQENIGVDYIRIITDKEASPFNSFIRMRPSVPFSVTIMLTTKCKTDCIYCYADRNEKIDFETGKVLSLIEDCYESDVMKLTLSGGDIFAYNKWKTIIDKMHNYNYISFISTKKPLNDEDILFLHQKGIQEIQFSLDSADEDDIRTIIKMNSPYLEDAKRMLTACKRYKIKVNIKTVLSKYNAKISTLNKLYQTLSEYDIHSWNLVPAFFSYYKEYYENYKATEESIKSCIEFIEEIRPKSKFYIKFNKQEDIEKTNSKYKTTEDFIVHNKNCLTSSHNLAINAYGQVALCEMLYNRSKFHLGNVKNKTIKELWNSDLVKDFFNFNLSSLPQNPESPCYKCKDYTNCKVGNAKKVCLVDIANIYGEEKWDYPDPRCPHAPECNMDLLLK